MTGNIQGQNFVDLMPPTGPMGTFDNMVKDAQGNPVGSTTPEAKVDGTAGDVLESSAMGSFNIDKLLLADDLKLAFGNNDVAQAQRDALDPSQPNVPILEAMLQLMDSLDNTISSLQAVQRSRTTAKNPSKGDSKTLSHTNPTPGTPSLPGGPSKGHPIDGQPTPPNPGPIPDPDDIPTPPDDGTTPPVDEGDTITPPVDGGDTTTPPVDGGDTVPADSKADSSGLNLWFLGNAFVDFAMSYANMQRTLMANKVVQGTIILSGMTQIVALGKCLCNSILAAAKLQKTQFLMTALCAGISMCVSAACLMAQLGTMSKMKPYEEEPSAQGTQKAYSKPPDGPAKAQKERTVTINGKEQIRGKYVQDKGGVWKQKNGEAIPEDDYVNSNGLSKNQVKMRNKQVSEENNRRMQQSQIYTSVSQAVGKGTDMSEALVKASTTMPIAQEQGLQETLRSLNKIAEQLLQTANEAFKNDTDTIGQTIQGLVGIRQKLMEAVAAMLKS